MRATALNLLMFAIALHSIAADSSRFYDATVIKTFPAGTANGQLGYAPDSGGDIRWASALTFDQQPNLYIADPMNARVVVLDSSLVFARNVPAGGAPLFINIDGDGNILCSWPGAFREYSSDGTLKVRIAPKGEDRFKSIIKSQNTYIHYLKGGELQGFVNPGPDPKLNNSLVLKGKAMSDAVASLGLGVQASGVTDGKPFQNGQLTIPTRPAVQGTQVVANGAILSTDFKTFLAPDAIAKASVKAGLIRGYSGKQQGEHLAAVLRDELVQLSVDSATGQSYWATPAAREVLTLDRQGEIIGYVALDPAKYGADWASYPAVSPDGNIYFLGYRGSTCSLMKITRDW